MSANFSSDSIVWVDGQVTLPKHILKILGIENGHRSNVTFIVENGEVKIVNSAAYAMNNLKKLRIKKPLNALHTKQLQITLTKNRS